MEDARRLIQEGIVGCRRCAIRETVRSPVPFSGPSSPVFAVLGEAPGSQENLYGRPFVGPAGILLRTTLARVGVDVRQVAFVNAVSCYPHRTPTAREIENCAEHRDAQLRYLDCRCVLAVGGVANSALWGDEVKVREWAGKWWWSERVGKWVYTALHPAAVLRDRGVEGEWEVGLELFWNGVQTNPWPGWHCVRCGGYTEIRVGPGWRLRGDGVPMCVKHWGQAKRRGERMRKRENLGRQLTIEHMSGESS